MQAALVRLEQQKQKAISDEDFQACLGIKAEMDKLRAELAILDQKVSSMQMTTSQDESFCDTSEKMVWLGIDGLLAGSFHAQIDKTLQSVLNDRTVKTHLLSVARSQQRSQLTSDGMSTDVESDDSKRSTPKPRRKNKRGARGKNPTRRGSGTTKKKIKLARQQQPQQASPKRSPTGQRAKKAAKMARLAAGAASGKKDNAVLKVKKEGSPAVTTLTPQAENEAASVTAAFRSENKPQTKKRKQKCDNSTDESVSKQTDIGAAKHKHRKIKPTDTVKPNAVAKESDKFASPVNLPPTDESCTQPQRPRKKLWKFTATSAIRYDVSKTQAAKKVLNAKSQMNKPSSEPSNILSEL